MHHLLNWMKIVLSPGTCLSFKIPFSGTKDLLATNVMNILDTIWIKFIYKTKGKGIPQSNSYYSYVGLDLILHTEIMVSMCKPDELGCYIQRKDGLEHEVSRSLSSDLTLTLLQNYNLWSPGYILDLLYALKESSYAKVKSYSTDIAPSSYAKA